MVPIKDKITRCVGQAIQDFKLISDGDRILVGLSGGKDSYTMLDILLHLQKKAPVKFEIASITIDSGFDNFNGKKISDYCAQRGYPHILHRTDILNIIHEYKNPKKSFCSFCARLRRGCLYTYASQHGYNKIALGHHADDAIETMLMNMFYSGSMKTMAPHHRADDGINTVIRPLTYVFEDDIIQYATAQRFPIICCGCPICKGESKRKRIKKLLRDLQKETPQIKSNLLNSLGNVVSSHLLTKRKVADEFSERASF